MASYCYFNTESPYAILGALSCYNKDTITFIPVSPTDHFDPLRSDRIRPGALVYFIDVVPPNRDVEFLLGRLLNLCIFSEQPAVISRLKALRSDMIDVGTRDRFLCPIVDNSQMSVPNVTTQISKSLRFMHDISTLLVHVDDALSVNPRLSNSVAILNGLMAKASDIGYLWRALKANTILDNLHAIGSGMANSIDKLLHMSLANMDTLTISIGESIYEVPICNTQVEETLVELSALAPFAIRYHISKNHYHYHLRSVKGGADVGSIARQLNGNGNENKATIIIDCTMVPESPKRFLMHRLQNLKTTYHEE